MKPALSVITLVNDTEAYAISRATLTAQHSDELEWLPIDADGQGWNAARGLNAGLDACRADWALCVHQDVLFPQGWWRGAAGCIESLPASAGLVALVGVDDEGARRGHVLDPHGHCRWGPLPSPVVGADEHVLLIRMDTGLRFDPETPGFHCYGTDLVLEALRRNVGAFVIDAPVVHLSGGSIDPHFDRASRWLFEKWGQARGGVLCTPSSVFWDRSPRSFPRWIRAKLAQRRSAKQRHTAGRRLSGGPAT